MLPHWKPLIAVGIAVLAFVAKSASADDHRETTVGMPAKIDQLVLPGPELEVKPLDDRKLPVVPRIVETYPHGTDFRYDLVYYGLEPGTFDLKDYLRRKDGSSTDSLPSVSVTVRPVLPPGQIEPHPLEAGKTPWLGGYRVLLAIIGTLWVLGLAAILWFTRRGKDLAQTTSDKPLTLAERLRPLVEKGLAGTLSPTQCAELERTLLAYWRRRLKLEQANPAEAIAVMRGDPAARPLLEQLESWLHRPGKHENVDVAALLKPYQNLPVDVLDTVAQGAGEQEGP